MNGHDRFDELLGRELGGDALTPSERQELDALATGPRAQERAAMRVVVNEVSLHLTPPVLDMEGLRPEPPPPWMLSELEAAAGVQAWAHVKARSAETPARMPARWWHQGAMRWLAFAALVIAVALPVGIHLRDADIPNTQVRGWNGNIGVQPVLLAPLGQTIYQMPVFVWLPAPGQSGPLWLALLQNGKTVWKCQVSRSPVQLANKVNPPTLQPGVSYAWELRTSDRTSPAIAFTLTTDANGAPGVLDEVSAALAAARAAAAAGRPADGIMLLALLPGELRADEAVRALRVKLTAALVPPGKPAANDH